MVVSYNIGVLAAGLLDGLITDGDIVNAESVEVKVLDVSLDIGDIDVSASPGLVEVDRREATKGQVATVAGCVAGDGHTEVWVHQAFLVHSSEDRVVMDGIFGSLIDTVGAVHEVRRVSKKR